jgi:hypothetical protein
MFSAEEDACLKALVHKFGLDEWDRVAEQMPNRSRRQCRERYVNYLAPALSNETWSPDEDALLVEKVRVYGQKWTQFVRAFPGRSTASIKNRWTWLTRSGQRLVAPPPFPRHRPVAILPVAFPRAQATRVPPAPFPSLQPAAIAAPKPAAEAEAPEGASPDAGEAAEAGAVEAEAAEAGATEAGAAGEAGAELPVPESTDTPKQENPKERRWSISELKFDNYGPWLPFMDRVEKLPYDPWTLFPNHGGKRW